MHHLGAMTHIAFFQSRETMAITFDNKRIHLFSLSQLQLSSDPLTLPENQYRPPIRCRHVTVIHSPSVSPKVEASAECCNLYVGTSQGVVSVTSILNEWKFGVSTLQAVSYTHLTLPTNREV
eukprot:TRINITY_DN1062_c0_g4_i1.p1 TRINITY_DN1062_c0_g4~~TRINITY_DN1062_c0_g4_i1.p1  ORF type:complete len:122 (-),score=7.57 TRINITY_DN1062_c0_g4_i1:44-409(-)